MAARQADPVVDRFGRVADAVCVRSEATTASPVGDEGLRSFDDVVGVGSNHQRWGLVTQVGIHSSEPGANRVWFVVLEKQTHHLVCIAQAPLRLRMGDARAAGPLAHGLGVVDSRHDGGKALTQDCLEASGNLRH